MRPIVGENHISTLACGDKIQEFPVHSHSRSRNRGDSIILLPYFLQNRIEFRNAVEKT